MQRTQQKYLIAQEKQKEKQFFIFTEVASLLANHFGYAGLVASGYFFKVAIAATVASYAAFLSALLVGGLLTYFATIMLRKGLDYFKVDGFYGAFAAFFINLALPPVVGALVFNATLGWGLALAPMLLMGGVSLAMGVGFIAIGSYAKRRETHKEMEQERKLFLMLEAASLLANHFGYAGLVASGYFFKVAIAATVASYAAFLSALLVGGLLTFFATIMLRKGLDYFKVDEFYSKMAAFLTTMALSPVVGALVVNATLGLGLALAPMLVMGGVSLAMGVGFFGFQYYNEQADKKKTRVSGGGIYSSARAKDAFEGAIDKYSDSRGLGMTSKDD